MALRLLSTVYQFAQSQMSQPPATSNPTSTMRHGDPSDMNGDRRPFRFLDLPVDIRLLIYSHLLTATTYSRMDVLQNEHRYRKHVEHGIEPNILRASRKVYAEAREVLIKSNLFIKLSSDDPEFRSILRTIGVPLVAAPDSVEEAEALGFKSEVAHLHVNCFRPNMYSLATEAFYVVIVHQDLLLALQAIATQHMVYSESLAEPDIALKVLEPLLGCSDKIESLSLSGITQMKILKPLAQQKRGWKKFTIHGAIKPTLKIAIEDRVRFNRFEPVVEVLEQLIQCKIDGNAHYDNGEYLAAKICFEDGAATLTEWLSKLRYPGYYAQVTEVEGKEFPIKLARLYFMVYVNAAANSLKHLEHLRQQALTTFHSKSDCAALELEHEISIFLNLAQHIRLQSVLGFVPTHTELLELRMQYISLALLVDTLHVVIIGGKHAKLAREMAPENADVINWCEELDTKVAAMR